MDISRYIECGRDLLDKIEIAFSKISVIIAMGIFVSIILVFIDILLGMSITNVTTETISNNQSVLSVATSALLLAAYILQYSTQSKQRKIMENQVSIMEANHTPVISISSIKWGSEVYEYPMGENKRNKRIITINNKGTGTAYDLKLKINLDPKDEPENLNFVFNTEPLINTDGSLWGPADEGAAVSPSDGEVDLVADTKIGVKRYKEVRDTGDFDRRVEEEYFHSLVDDELDSCDTVRLYYSIKYRTTSGEECTKELDLVTVEREDLLDKSLALSTQKSEQQRSRGR